MKGERNTERSLRWALAALVIITAAGAFFRLYLLDQRGIWFVDTAGHIIDARGWLAGGKLLGAKWSLYKKQSPQEIFTEFELRGGCTHAAKPATGFFRAVAMAIFGDTVGASHIALAFFGIVSIPLLYFFAQRLFNDVRLSLVAATFLALSPTHVSYSRGLKSEADTMVFVVLGLWVYYEGALRRGQPSSPRWMWASGLLAGTALACNGRFVDVVPLFLLMPLVEMLCLRRPLLGSVGNLTRVVAAMGLMLVFWELPYHWAILAWHGSGVKLHNFWTYWQGTSHRLATHSFFHWHLDAWPAYFYFWFRYEALVAALAFFGIGAVFRSRRRFESVMVTFWMVLGLVVFLGAHLKVYYLVSFTLPAFCMLAASGVRWLGDLRALKQRPVLQTGMWSFIGVAVAAWSINFNLGLARQQSRLHEATAWLRQHRPGQKVISTSYEPTVCEYDFEKVAPLPWPFEKRNLVEIYNRGARLLLVDQQKFSAVLPSEEPVQRQLLPGTQAFVSPLLAEIEAKTPPIATFTNRYDSLYFFVFASHHNLHLAKTRQFLAYVNPRVDAVIRLYDLSDVFMALGIMILPDDQAQSP